MPYPAPTTIKAYAHYRALKAAPCYLKVAELEGECIYVMHGRNSYLGIWRVELQAFTILRDKIGIRRLDIELHWDTNDLHGTAKPFVKLSGPIASDQRRQALEVALASMPHERFMEVTASFAGTPAPQATGKLPRKPRRMAGD